VVATFPSQTRDAVQYLAFLKTAPTTPSAAPAANSPALPFQSLDGAPFDASTVAGKVLVVNFWATWCVPCRKEIPAFNQMHKDFAGQPAAIIGVSLDEDGANAVKPFLAKNPMDYPVALGSEAARTKFAIGPDDPLPITLVLDRQGKLVHKFQGLAQPQDIKNAVKQAL